MCSEGCAHLVGPPDKLIHIYVSDVDSFRSATRLPESYLGRFGLGWMGEVLIQEYLTSHPRAAAGQLQRKRLLD